MTDDYHYDNDQAPDDEGTRYTGGDYDPGEVDIGSGEFYAYSESDYVDTTRPTNGLDDERTVFQRNENGRNEKTSTRPTEGAEHGPARPKEAILREIQQRLEQDEHLTLDNIKVTVNDTGGVTLEGTIEQLDRWSRYEEVVQNIAGVTNVINRLLISPPKSKSGA